MLKPGVTVINEKGVSYRVDEGGGVITFRPWLADSFAFLYDVIMKRSIFPKKFAGDMDRHYEILGGELHDVHEKRVLELATGSGSAVHFLPNDNQYIGTDISPGLLRKAVPRFERAGFKNTAFYVTSAEDLPFDDNAFDFVICILSLNFFKDAARVFREVERVAAPNATFVCSVPVPERQKVQRKIRGTLYSEAELKRLCEAHGLSYQAVFSENGALLYFRATMKEAHG